MLGYQVKPCLNVWAWEWAVQHPSDELPAWGVLGSEAGFFTASCREQNSCEVAQRSRLEMQAPPPLFTSLYSAINVQAPDRVLEEAKMRNARSFRGSLQSDGNMSGRQADAVIKPSTS